MCFTRREVFYSIQRQVGTRVGTQVGPLWETASGSHIIALILPEVPLPFKQSASQAATWRFEGEMKVLRKYRPNTPVGKSDAASI